MGEGGATVPKQGENLELVYQVGDISTCVPDIPERTIHPRFEMG